MLYQLICNHYVLAIVCALCVFGEMFVAKKWFTSFTKKMTSARARRGMNVILGIVTCFALSAAQMFAFCDVLTVTFMWKWVIVSTCGATLLYLILEKVFTDSELKELGEAFRELVSHSDLFDGDLSKDGVIAVAQKIFDITTALDEEIAAKEEKAVDEVVKKLDEFIKDGNITAAERAQAEQLVKKYGSAVTGTTTYEKYKALLNK